MVFRSSFARVLSIGAAGLLLATAAPGDARVGPLAAPTGLTVDAATELIGMDDPAPGFAWKLALADARARDVVQGGYRIRVAPSAAALAQGRAAMWDSGRVAAADQVGVRYAGKPLASARRYWWQVRTWDGKGGASPWSAPASFVTGFLHAADWSDRARWIALPQRRAGLAGATWIWRAGAGPARFRKTIVVPALAGGTAMASVGATGAFTLAVDGRIVPVAATTDRVRDFDLLPYLRAGANRIEIAVSPDAKEDRRGVSLRAEMRRADGTLLLATTGADWSASGDGTAWTAATPVAGFGEAPFVDYLWHGGTVNDPPPLLRRTFAAKRRVAEALLFVSGLGVYQATLNGAPVGDDVVPPAWTDYGHAVPYRTYDVTRLVAGGDNVLGLRLGNGWFDYQSQTLIDRKGLNDLVPVVRHWGTMRAKVQLRLRYTDGTVEDVVSDDRWTAAAGPHAMAHVFGSEIYDARAEPKGWTRSGFDDRGWRRAVESEAPPGVLMAQIAPPTIVTAHYPGRVLPPRPGVAAQVIDFGINTNARYRIRLKGVAGQVVRIVPGEILGPDGRVVPTRSGDRETFSLCTLSGGDDVCSLDFSTAGYRYLGLTAARPVRIAAADSDAVSTAAPVTGAFATSDPRYDAIYRIALNTLDSNMMTVKTDCTTYEKLGWGEVLATLSPSYAYAHDVARLWHQFADNNRRAQRPDGQQPNIVPGYTRGNNEKDELYDQAPAWGRPMFVVPWTLYQSYGDTRALADSYDAMTRYAAFLRTRETAAGIIDKGLGDWMSTAGRMDPNIESAAYADDLHILSQVAAALGKTRDAARYAAEFVRVAAAYNAAFYDPAAKRYRPDNQGAQAIPLAFALVPPGDEAAVRAALVDTIRHPGTAPVRDGMFGPVLPDHIAAGDIATTYVWQALGDMRRSDLVDRMITQPSAPSYWNMVTSGLTAVPEAWHYPTARSWNHDMYTGIVEWFYRSVGGIAPARPGYATVRIAPVPPPGMAHARVRYDSVRGAILSEWRHDGTRFVLDVEVPPNARAEVVMPGSTPMRLADGGQAVGARRDGDGTIRIGSGRYRFESTLD